MIELEVCKISDPRYQTFRDRHYVENHGAIGRQIHFLIWKDETIVGIISGASSVYSVKARDIFFEINQQNRDSLLPHLVNNTVFRLESHEKNLATMVLSTWRKVVTLLWEKFYGTSVIGFETFVVETPTRVGALYKADNWTFLGQTAGSTKVSRNISNPHKRATTAPKLIYCRWADLHPVAPTGMHVSSWANETPEEKRLAKELQKKRAHELGVRYHTSGRNVVGRATGNPERVSQEVR